MWLELSLINKTFTEGNASHDRKHVRCHAWLFIQVHTREAMYGVRESNSKLALFYQSDLTPFKC